MRCPKCGESFQVTTPALSEPPVLGAALGLKKDAAPQAPPRHKQTMLGVAAQGAGSISPPGAAPRPPPPRAATKKTMMGVAPGLPAGGGFELASLEDDQPEELDVDELDLTSTVGDELDLSPHGDEGELDLPSPSNRPGGQSSELDLPAALGSDEMEADLPSLGGGLPDLPSLPNDDGLGLPDLSSGGADLPSPAAAGLPDLAGDLPDLSAGLPELDAGLPIVGGNLPQAAGQLSSLAADLPDHAPGGAGGGLDPFGDAEGGGPASFDFSSPGSDHGLDLSAPPPAPDYALGSEADDIFGQGPTHAPESIEPPPPDGDPSSFGEVNFGSSAETSVQVDPPEPDDADDEFDAFPTADSDGGGAARSVGGAGYGDVALDDDGGGHGGGLDLGDDVDRGPAPDPGHGPVSRAGAAATAQVELPKSGDAKKAKEAEKKKRLKTSGLSKATRAALAGALLFAVGGGALAMVPDIGPYGAYLIVDTVNADAYRSALAEDVKDAEKMIQMDTAGEVSNAFTEVDTGRRDAPRYKPRMAYAAYVGLFHQLRFGASTSVSTQAKVLLDGLKDADPETQYVALAKLVHQAVSGKGDAVVGSAKESLEQGPEFAAVVGEAALGVGDAKVAERAWKVVLKAGPSAQAHFGLARTMKLAKKPEEAREHMDQALRLNPSHAGARLLLAEIQLSSRDFDDQILKSLTPLSEGKGASQGEQVSALVILGDLHLTRARLKKAEASFQKALKIDSGSATAQRGLAQTLFDSGRHSEALARFEASLQKNPKDLAANLGLVECKLRLEKLDDAVKHLEKLKADFPKSSAVAYWEGRGRESVGEKEDALKAYERAIELGEESPELVRSYIALTRLLSQKGNLEEAAKVIEQAEERFPDDPAVYEALGELSTSRGSYDEAVADYDKALKLDPNNIGLRFSRGIALRQARRFDEAAVEFDKVEKESTDYPGLALERGNLYQASDRLEEALKAYEAALKAAPEDKDLMLRVACGKAEAGQGKPALELLAPVLEERANSAEVNFCQGLALLNMEDFTNAKIYLARAVAQDATRAKYHLYVGWVALELKDMSQATASLNKAIELDRTLADAYWKRGDLLVQSAAVQDALLDINRALELSPSRLDAHASAARAYEQIGKEQEALAAWEKAVGAPVVEPAWRYQYGKLLFVNRRVPEARVQLEKCVEGAKKLERPPTWLPDAHRYLAMSIGRSVEALPHWDAYSQAKAGSNDPYLREALTEMKAIMDMTGN